jgi:tetratricopeptide (TPR) repeat protein
MNQLPQKYQLAWFKLSEFIKRGEKERALGIYKLLMHTVDDFAFAKQLEGDILLFFNDPNASQSYLDAAHLYKKAHKLAQATAVYEHLVAQFPHEQNFLAALIACYAELGSATRITLSFGRLLNALVRAQPARSIAQALDQLAPLLTQQDAAQLYINVVTQLIHQKTREQKVLDALIKKTLSYLEPAEQKTFLQTIHAQTSNS